MEENQHLIKQKEELSLNYESQIKVLQNDKEGLLVKIGALSENINKNELKKV